MEIFDQVFGQMAVGIFDDIVDTAEVIGGFDNVISFYAFEFALGKNSVRFEDITSLVVGQSAAFDMVRIIG